MRKNFWVTLLVWGMGTFYAFIWAQDSLAARMDQLFESYQSLDNPGYVVGIIQNGKLIYKKGFGSANLDYNIPLTDTSMFYIGSMAKQFTAAALLVLEAKGLLDIQKPVRHYLPDFPEYGDTIKVYHLIHHTSGIRETNSLQLFQGIDLKFEAVFDTDDLYQLVLQQKALNFKPGTEYRYSSGGYAVLAKIIEKISGQSLRSFLHDHIFGPLNMTKTFVCDNHNEIIPNRVVSYWPVGKQYERRSLVFDAYGDGGIMTCLVDLIKWDQIFYKGWPELPNFAEQMYEKGILNNGTAINYANALNVWEYQGKKVVQHNGGMLGFRVDLVRFPDQRFSVIALANMAFSNPTRKALEIAEWYFPKIPSKVEVPMEENNLSDLKIDTLLLKNREGVYWSDDINKWCRLSYEKGGLFLDYGDLSQRKKMQFLSQDTLKLGENTIVFSQNKGSFIMKLSKGGNLLTYHSFDPTPPSSFAEVEKLVGSYYSSELDATYQFYHKDNTFQLKINDNDPIELFPIPESSRVIWNSKRMVWIGFAELKFDENEKGQIVGFRIGDGRVKNVPFKKKTNF